MHWFTPGIKTTVIYPATAKHVKKYSAQQIYLINETAEDYNKITLPYIEAASFDIQVRFETLQFPDKLGFSRWWRAFVKEEEKKSYVVLKK